MRSCRMRAISRPLKWEIGTWQIFWYVGPDLARWRGFTAHLGIIKLLQFPLEGSMLSKKEGDYEGFIFQAPRLVVVYSRVYTFVLPLPPEGSGKEPAWWQWFLIRRVFRNRVVCIHIPTRLSFS